ncbi:hypothetical protein PG984_010268 [Apiospora sp. TS-2023a]
MSHQALARLPKPSHSVAPPREDDAVTLWASRQPGDANITQGISFDDHDFSDNNYTLSAPSLEGGVTAPTPPTVIARWRGEIDLLSAEQRQLFLRNLPQAGLQTYVDAVGDLISDKVQKSQSLRVGRWIAPLVQLVDMSRPFADALNSIYPPACMILGGVSFVLSMSKRFVDYQEAVLAFLVKVCKNLSIIDRYKERFQTEEMQLALIDVYGDIIQFCARASRPFLDSKGKPRMTAVSFFKSQIKSFEEEFGDLEKNIATHLEVFDRVAILVLGQMSAHLQQTQLIGLKMQARSHEVDKRRHMEEEERRVKALAKEQDEFRRHILNWISLTDFRAVQDDKLENTLPGTAQWLLEHDSFKDWKLQSQPSLLYLRGKAGSGKSHLAARVIRNIDLWCREQNSSLARLEKQPKYAVAYVYCGTSMAEPSSHKNPERNAETRGGGAAILSSILRQLYSFLPRDEDITLLKDLHLENQSSNPSVEDVRESIRSIVAKFARTFIVNITANSSTLHEIKNSLSKDADGMFLWVKLGIDSVKKERTDNKRKQAARNMPKSLAGAYSKALERVMAQEESVRDIALRALLWIANSERPLTKIELLEALSIEPGMTGLEPGDRIDDLSLAKDCADLVVFRNGQCSLLHLSLKEYLTHPQFTASEPLTGYWRLQSEAHIILAETCLTYLMFDTFKEKIIKTTEDRVYLTESYPLLGYTSASWGRHAAKLGATGKDRILVLAREFLQTGQLRHLWGLLMTIKRPVSKPLDLQPLHLISFFGLTDLLPYFDRAELQSQLNLMEGLGQLPIDLATKQRHRDMADWLLGQHELCGKLSSKKPLVWFAARNNWVDIIARLLSMGLDGNDWGVAPSNIRITALQISARRGSDEAALSLINAGVDVNLRNDIGATALVSAIVSKRLRIVDALLDNGADVTICDRNGNNALHHAIGTGLLEPALRILGFGTDIVSRLNLDTGLGIAVVSGVHGLIGPLLDHGAMVDCRNSTGDTPLAAATSKGDLTAVKILLSRGANITTRNYSGLSLLHQLFLAPPPKRIHLLQWLLQHGDEYAGPDQIVTQESDVESSLLLCLDNYRRTPLQLAAYYGDVESMRLMIKSPIWKLLITDHGDECLKEALRGGHFDCSQVLLETCSDTIPDFPLSDNDLMGHAAKSGNGALVPLILGHGGSLTATEKYGANPLHVAVQFGKAGFVRSLIDQGLELDYYQKDEDGQTALHYAAANGNLEVIELLLPHYETDKYMGDLDGDWPIHEAAKYGYIECVKALVRFDHVSPQRCNNEGETPLHLAAIEEEKLIVEHLLTVGADVNATCCFGDTPLFEAINNHHYDVSFSIISCGAPLPIANEHGATPLHLAAEQGATTVADRMLDLGWDPNPLNRYEETPFYTALRYCNTEIVDLYLSRGLGEADLRRSDEFNCALATARSGSLDMWRKIVGIEKSLAYGGIGDGEYSGALGIAAYNGHTHMLRDMLAMGLDVDGKDKWGGTAIQAAACAGNVAAVRYLCENGAKLNHQDSYGRTALHWAYSYNFKSCRDALIDAGADQQIRNEFGLLAMDYDIDSDLARSESLGRSQPTNPYIRRSAARKFVIETIRMIKANQIAFDDGQSAGFRKDPRNWSVLSEALHLLGDVQTSAIIERKRHISYRWNYYCDICRQDIEKDESAIPSFACPSLVKHLEDMELALVPVRTILRPMAQYGACMLLEVFKSLPVFCGWVDKRAQSYDEWKSRCSKQGWRFTQTEIPGWELIGILIHVKFDFNAGVKPPGTPSGSLPRPNVDNMDLTSRLRMLFRDHSPDLEPMPYNCEGHRYLEIAPTAELPEEMGAMFDSENELTEAFFNTVEEKHSPREKNSVSPDDNTQNEEANPRSSGLEDPRTDPAPAGSDRQSDDDPQPPEEQETDSEVEDSTSSPSITTSEDSSSVGHGYAEEARNVQEQLGSIQHDLLTEWKANQLEKDAKAHGEQELVLETAWQLAQAIAYNEVVYAPLADLHHQRMGELIAERSSGRAVSSAHRS